MEFKKLELEQERGWFKRILGSSNVRKSVIAIIIGAIAGFLIFFFTEGRDMDVIVLSDVLKSVAIGGFFGFFITNSPCARGRC